MASQTQNPKNAQHTGKLSRPFASYPGESDLSIPFLEGLGATSSIGEENENGIWRIFQKPIPVKAIAIWMYSCCLVIFPAIIFFASEPTARKPGFILCFAGALMIVPAMLAILHYINEALGTEARSIATLSGIHLRGLCCTIVAHKPSLQISKH